MTAFCSSDLLVIGAAASNGYFWFYPSSIEHTLQVFTSWKARERFAGREFWTELPSSKGSLMLGYEDPSWNSLGARWQRKASIHGIVGLLNDLDWSELRQLLSPAVISKCSMYAGAKPLRQSVSIVYQEISGATRLGGDIGLIAPVPQETSFGFVLEMASGFCRIYGPAIPDRDEFIIVLAHELGHKLGCALGIMPEELLEKELQAWAIAELMLRVDFAESDPLWTKFSLFRHYAFSTYMYSDRYLQARWWRIPKRAIKFLQVFRKRWYFVKYLQYFPERALKLVDDVTRLAIEQYVLPADQREAVEKGLPITFRVDLRMLALNELPA